MFSLDFLFPCFLWIFSSTVFFGFLSLAAFCDLNWHGDGLDIQCTEVWFDSVMDRHFNIQCGLVLSWICTLILYAGLVLQKVITRSLGFLLMNAFAIDLRWQGDGYSVWFDSPQSNHKMIWCLKALQVSIWQRTKQKLWILSSVTFICQVTKIVRFSIVRIDGYIEYSVWFDSAQSNHKMIWWRFWLLCRFPYDADFKKESQIWNFENLTFYKDGHLILVP